MWQYLVAPLAVIALLAIPKKTSQVKKNDTSNRAGEVIRSNGSGPGSCDNVKDGSESRELELRPILTGDERISPFAEVNPEGDRPCDGDKEAGVDTTRIFSPRAHSPSISGDPDQIPDA